LSKGRGSLRAHSLTVVLALCLAPLPVAALALVPGVALGAQTANLSAAFAPERLGAPTTVSFGFEIHGEGGAIPSPLTGIDFHYPAELGLGTSGLGLAACEPTKLRVHGPKACPANSIMGSGSALAKFQDSPEISEETATISLVAGPSEHGYIKLLISATGSSPVAARIVMSSLLVPGQLKISVPLVEGAPETPDVAVVRVHVIIGGKLTYYERKHGEKVAYRPQGVTLPRTCPKGGFKFAATFSFLDGTTADARTVVKCPRGRG
jgi:hypothetical protein